jgi:ABC-type phosphate transport system substrate-binding protein
MKHIFTIIFIAASFFNAVSADIFTNLKEITGEIKIADTSGGNPIIRQAAFAAALANPKLKISIEQTNLANAVKLVKNKKADLVIINSRLPLKYRKALKPEVMNFAAEAVVFMVNSSNPANNIKEAVLREIFAGNIGTWNSINSSKYAIHLAGIKKGECGWLPFTRWILMDKEIKARMFFVSNANEIQVLAGANKNLLGYCGWTDSLSPKVKLLSVSGVSPTEQNIQAGKYRPIVCYSVCVPGSASKNAKLFALYLCSKELAEMKKNSGFVPLTN